MTVWRTRAGHGLIRWAGIAALMLAAVSGLPAAEAEAGEHVLIYDLVPERDRHERAAVLAEVLGIEQAELDRGEVLRYVDAKRFQHVPVRRLEPTDVKQEDEGPVRFQGLNFRAIRNLEVLDDGVAAKQLHAALDESGLLPAGVEAKVSHTRFSAVNARGRTVVKNRAIDTRVTYPLAVGGVPLIGPGAEVGASFNGKGVVTQLTHALLQLEPAGEVEVLGAEEAVQSCEAVLGRRTKVAAPRLVYYAPTLDQGKQVLPHYECGGLSQTGARLRQTLISAVTGEPMIASELQPTDRDGQGHRSAKASAASRHASVYRGEVGTEWIGVSQGLPGSDLNGGGFVNRMSGAGAFVRFNWGDFNAWEQDFKDPSKGGDDSNWVDNTDLTFYTGHANGDGWTFPGNMDDGFLHYNDASYGERDLEWLVIAACGPLQFTEGGKAWWQRWGQAFNGLHLLSGYQNISYVATDEGSRFADYAVRANALTIRQAWTQTAIDVQPSSVRWATMGVWGQGGLAAFNDYYHGSGPVGPDLRGSQIHGYWMISGAS